MIQSLVLTQLEQLPLLDFADGADGIDGADGVDGHCSCFSKKNKKCREWGSNPQPLALTKFYPVGVPVALVTRPQRVSFYEHFRV